MRHIWATAGPGVKSRENAVLSPQSARPALMVHDTLTI